MNFMEYSKFLKESFVADMQEWQNAALMRKECRVDGDWNGLIWKIEKEEELGFFGILQVSTCLQGKVENGKFVALYL